MKYKIGDKVKVVESNIYVKTRAIGKIINTEEDGYFILFNKKDIKSRYEENKNIYLLESRIRKYKVKTKPKVYAWDRSAIREQKKLEQEQRDIFEIQKFLQNAPQIFMGRRQDGKSITHFNELIDKLCLCAIYGIVFDNKIN